MSNEQFNNGERNEPKMGGPRTLWEALLRYNAPWMIWLYIFLLVSLVVMMFYSLSLISEIAGPSNFEDTGTSNIEDDIRKVLNLAIENFKFVLGALIGALAMAVQKKWRDVTEDKSERKSSSAN